MYARFHGNVSHPDFLFTKEAAVDGTTTAV
jgi:hypothetical protein